MDGRIRWWRLLWAHRVSTWCCCFFLLRQITFLLRFDSSHHISLIAPNEVAECFLLPFYAASWRLGMNISLSWCNIDRNTCNTVLFTCLIAWDISSQFTCTANKFAVELTEIMTFGVAIVYSCNLNKKSAQKRLVNATTTKQARENNVCVAPKKTYTHTLHVFHVSSSELTRTLFMALHHMVVDEFIICIMHTQWRFDCYHIYISYDSLLPVALFACLMTICTYLRVTFSLSFSLLHPFLLLLFYSVMIVTIIFIHLILNSNWIENGVCM